MLINFQENNISVTIVEYQSKYQMPQAWFAFDSPLIHNHMLELSLTIICLLLSIVVSLQCYLYVFRSNSIFG